MTKNSLNKKLLYASEFFHGMVICSGQEKKIGFWPKGRDLYWVSLCRTHVLIYCPRKAPSSTDFPSLIF